MFCRDDTIVFALAGIAFKDLPGKCHFVPKKGKHLQSRQEAYIAYKEQFVGINTACQECNMGRDIISKMQYKGELQNCNWDKHCAKFHQQLAIIDKWAVAGMAICMSNEDQISTFLKTIPKDYKNGELVIANGIIEGDWLCDATLVGNVIPMLSPTINTMEHGVPVPMHTIAITNTHSWSCDSSGKCCQTGHPKTTTGKWLCGP